MKRSIVLTLLILAGLFLSLKAVIANGEEMEDMHQHGENHPKYSLGSSSEEMKDMLWLETKADSSYVGTERMIEIKFGELTLKF